MANFVPLILGEATLLIGADRTAMSTALAASRLEAEGVFGRIAAAGGAAMLGVGTAAVIGLGLATKAASDLEFAVSAAGAVGQATESQMRGIRDRAIELSKDSVYGATEIVRGMEEIIKAGISVDDVLNGAAKSTVVLAQASGTTLANAADTVAQAMGVWKLQAGDMPELINRLAAASNESRFDVQDLTLAIGMGGAQARVSGIAYQDFLTIIAATAPNFNSGSDAGTSFKTMLMRLTPYTKPAAAEMERLGIITKDGSNRFFDAAGNTRSLAEIIDVLHGATKNLTEEQKILSLRTIFQADAQRMAGAMAAMTGDEFNALSESMKNIDAEEIAVKRLDNTRGALLRLFRTIQGQALDIGGNVLGGADIKDKANAAAPQIRRMAVGFQEGLSGEDNPSQGGDWGPAVNGATEFGRILREEVLPRIHEFSDWITGTVLPALSNFATHDVWPKLQWFAGFMQDEVIPAIKGFGEEVGGPTAKFLADHKELVVSLGIVYGAWKLAAFLTNAELVISAALTKGMALAEFVLTTLQLVKGVQSWTEAQALLNIVLAANPIGIVIAAMAALVVAGVLVYKNWDEIRNKAEEVWNWLQENWTQLGPMFIKAWEFIILGAPDLWGLKSAIIGAALDASEWLVKAGANIVGGIIKGIGSMIGHLWDAMKSALGDKLWGPFADFWGISSPSTVMEEAGENIVEGLANGIEAGTGKAVAAMKRTSQAVKAAANEGMESISGLTGIITDLTNNKVTNPLGVELFGSGQGIMIGDSALPITSAFANYPGSREALTAAILNNGRGDVVNQLPRALELWDAARTVKVELSSDLQLEGVQ